MATLPRPMAAIQAIASGPGVDSSWTGTAARIAVDAVALLLPPLDAATRTEWVVYGAPTASGFALAVTGLLVYTALLAAAGLFDFQRRGA